MVTFRSRSRLYRRGSLPQMPWPMRLTWPSMLKPQAIPAFGSRSIITSQELRAQPHQSVSAMLPLAPNPFSRGRWHYAA